MSIEKAENYDIVTGAGEGLTSFFIPGEVDRAFKVNEWTLAEMVEILTDIARETSTKVITRKDGTIIEEPVVTPRERMAAIAMLEKKAKDSMVLGGFIQKDQLQVRKTLSDGTTAEFNAEGMRLTREGSSRLQNTLSLLEQARDSNTSEIIDVEAIENDPDTRTDVCLKRSRTEHGNGPRTAGTTADGGGNGADPESSNRDGDGEGMGIYGEQRTSPRDPFGEGEDDDQETVRGADNARETGISQQLGRISEGQGVGGQSGEDRGGDWTDFEPLDEADGSWWGGSFTPEPAGDTGGPEPAGDIAARVALEAQNRYLEKRKSREHPGNAD